MLKDLLMARHWLGTWGWRLPLTQQGNVPWKRFDLSLLFIIVVLTFFWDAGRGLEYLHEHCYPAVIHRDMKSSNILLDANFNAKVRKWHHKVTSLFHYQLFSSFVVFYSPKLQIIMYLASWNLLVVDSAVWFWSSHNWWVPKQEEH